MNLITKTMWLNVTHSNNLPSHLAAYYLEAVEEYKGCRIDLVTDLGAENGIIAETCILSR